MAQGNPEAPELRPGDKIMAMGVGSAIGAIAMVGIAELTNLPGLLDIPEEVWQGVHSFMRVILGTDVLIVLGGAIHNAVDGHRQ